MVKVGARVHTTGSPGQRRCTAGGAAGTEYSDPVEDGIATRSYI